MADRYPLLAREFPDYEASSLPEIPADWEEASWHNDVCPSWQTPASGRTYLHIFIDYLDPDQRELGDQRFSVSEIDEDGDSGHLMDTDDWQAVLNLASSHA